MYFICSIFDVFLLYIYLQQVMGNRKEIPFPLYVLAFAGDEIILTLCSFVPFFSSETLQNNFILIASTLLTFALTLLHESTFRHRVFVTVSFQVCASLSELVIIVVFSSLPHNLSALLLSNISYGALCSKILMFLFINIIMLFFRRTKTIRSANYTALILLMPILSLILILAIPVQEKPDITRTIINFIVTAGILSANIVNYFLLQNILKIHEMHQTEDNLKKQIKYQTSKYQQLSTAYQDTRRLIHDTKKHFFYIKNCVDTHKYEDISPYLQDSIANMENTFIRVNTGNLVIDSFISNYMSLSRHEGIQFKTDIQISPNTIPIKDYDLSIILGNLLDNAFSSCRSVPHPKPRQISVELFSSTKELLIHIENSAEDNPSTDKSELELLNHGYGTKNIEAITIQYNGIYSHYIKNESYHAIVSIPIISGTFS